jgi:hypothetical protein
MRFGVSDVLRIKQRYQDIYVEQRSHLDAFVGTELRNQFDCNRLTISLWQHFKAIDKIWLRSVALWGCGRPSRTQFPQDVLNARKFLGAQGGKCGFNLLCAHSSKITTGRMCDQ